MTTRIALITAFMWAIAAGAAPPDVGPAEVAKAFRAALSAGDQARVLELLAPEVVIMEEGYVERSREEYAQHHLPADVKFSKQVSYMLDRQTSGTGETLAWIASEGRVRGTVDGKDVDQISTETLVFKKIESQWRIVHVHWSGRKAGK